MQIRMEIKHSPLPNPHSSSIGTKGRTDYGPN